MKLLALVSIVFTSAMGYGARQAASPCGTQLPAGFVERDSVGWSGPWVFRAGGGTDTALPWVGLRSGRRSLPIHLDDGRGATVHIEEGECKPGQTCASDDCCSISLAPSDSLWLVADDSSGRSLFREHFWAPYQDVEVVPVDLVDGPGDEVMIVRTWAHASPAVGFALEIWKVGGSRPVELSGRVIVGAWLTTWRTNWRADLVVDPTQPKPRAIGVRRTFGALDCEPLTASDRAAAAALGRASALVFDRASGKYDLR